MPFIFDSAFRKAYLPNTTDNGLNKLSLEDINRLETKAEEKIKPILSENKEIVISGGLPDWVIEIIGRNLKEHKLEISVNLMSILECIRPYSGVIVSLGKPKETKKSKKPKGLRKPYRKEQLDYLSKIGANLREGNVFKVYLDDKEDDSILGLMTESASFPSGNGEPTPPHIFAPEISDPKRSITICQSMKQCKKGLILCLDYVADASKTELIKKICSGCSFLCLDSAQADQIKSLFQSRLQKDPSFRYKLYTDIQAPYSHLHQIDEDGLWEPVKDPHEDSSANAAHASQQPGAAAAESPSRAHASPAEGGLFGYSSSSGKRAASSSDSDKNDNVDAHLKKKFK